MNPTRDPQKAIDSARIAEETARFLASGGTIHELPAGLTPEQREAANQPWTNSLGALSKPRKQGEYTVVPGWEDKPKEHPAQRRAKRHGRPVRLTRDGEVKEFPSAREAARDIGVSQGSISSALKKGTKTRGWAVTYTTIDEQ